MNSFLKYRIQFITIIFAAFGGILSFIMDINSIQPWSYAAIASIIALVTSLLISLLLKGKWTKQMRKRVRGVSIVLFILFLFSCFLFLWLFRFQLTFEMKEINAFHTSSDSSGINQPKIVRYVKGVYYTPEARKYLIDNPGEDINPSNMVKAFGGSSQIDLVWDKRSRDLAQFYLFLSYCAFLVFSVANISLICEVLVTKYSDKTKGIDTKSRGNPD